MRKEIDTYLLLKYFRCETTPAEEASVAHWLASDPDGSHAKVYREARILFEGLTLYSPAVPAEGRRNPVVPKPLKVALQIAAAVAIVVVSAIGGGRIVRESYTREFRTFNVPAGKSMQMTLADGTRMWLNGGSEVAVPVLFSSKGREIRLNNGEIFLDVKRDERRPFTVDTYAGKVEVLGTKFNVEVDENHRMFETSLIEGSVKVSTCEGECFLMKPNDVVSMKDNVWTVGRMSHPYSVTCWIDGLIDIANIPFDKLMYDFEQAFNVSVVIVRKELPELTFTRGKIRISD
ncbi:MAG: FecR family protein, partial [Candidatus Cryptobacteroides sp.]